MKIRFSEKRFVPDWTVRFSRTIDTLKKGEVAAIHYLEHCSSEEWNKAMDDMCQLITADRKSVVWKQAAKELGEDFELKVLNVYNYMKAVNKLRSEGAY